MRQLPEVGLEPTLCCHNGILNPDPTSKNKALAVDGAQNGAQPPDGGIIDAELATVNTCWPLLPDHIKAAILTLVNSAKGDEK